MSCFYGVFPSVTGIATTFDFDRVASNWGTASGLVFLAVASN